MAKPKLLTSSVQEPVEDDSSLSASSQEEVKPHGRQSRAGVRRNPARSRKMLKANAASDSTSWPKYHHPFPQQQQHYHHQGSVYQFTPPPTISPIMQLLLNRYDPRPLSKLFLQSFNKLRLEDSIDKVKTLKMLKMWKMNSVLVGADLSWGNIDVMAGLVGFSKEDLEVPGFMVTDEIRRIYAQRETKMMMEGAEELKKTIHFRNANPDDEKDVPVTMITIDGQNLRKATNAAYDRLFRGENYSMMDELADRKACPGLCFANHVDRADYEVWFSGLCDMMFSTGRKKHSRFLKLLHCDGLEHLYFVHAKQVEFIDEAGEYQHGCVIRMDPAPASKYLNLEPAVEEGGRTRKRRTRSPLAATAAPPLEQQQQSVAVAIQQPLISPLSPSSIASTSSSSVPPMRLPSVQEEEEEEDGAAPPIASTTSFSSSSSHSSTTLSAPFPDDDNNYSPPLPSLPEDQPLQIQLQQGVCNGSNDDDLDENSFLDDLLEGLEEQDANGSIPALDDAMMQTVFHEEEDGGGEVEEEEEEVVVGEHPQEQKKAPAAAEEVGDCVIA